MRKILWERDYLKNSYFAVWEGELGMTEEAFQGELAERMLK